MSNTIVNISDITKVALADFRNELVMGNLVYRDYETQFTEKKGDTINLRRPVRFEAKAGPYAQAQEIVEGTIPLTINQDFNVVFGWGERERSLKIEQIRERYIIPAMRALAVKVESSIANLTTGIYNLAGTRGTTPASYDAFAEGTEILNRLGVPMDKRAAILTPKTDRKVKASIVALNNPDMVKSTFERARRPDIDGVPTFMTQMLRRHTLGAHGGTPLVRGAAQNVTYDTSKSGFTQTLQTDGWTSAVGLKAGDVFTITGVNSVNYETKADTGVLQQFVITANVTTNATTSSATELTISPPIITSGPYQTVSAAPADDAPISYIGTASTTYGENLIFHRDAIALAMVKMDKPEGNVKFAQESEDGFNISAYTYFDGDNRETKLRFDAVWGTRLINPGFAARLTE